MFDMERTDLFLLVFVCTGNICRSPMAEGIMKNIILDRAQETGVSPNIKVISAGTHATDGYPASEHAITVASEEGITIGTHRSRMLTDDIVLSSDLILTMERAHTDIIKRVWPEARHLMELKRFGRNATGDSEVSDPIGMGVEVYRSVFKEIQRELNRSAPLIFRMAEEKAEKLS